MNADPPDWNCQGAGVWECTPHHTLGALTPRPQLNLYAQHKMRLHCVQQTTATQSAQVTEAEQRWRAAISELVHLRNNNDAGGRTPFAATETTAVTQHASSCRGLERDGRDACEACGGRDGAVAHAPILHSTMQHRH